MPRVASWNLVVRRLFDACGGLSEKANFGGISMKALAQAALEPHAHEQHNVAKAVAKLAAKLAQKAKTKGGAK